MFRNGLRTVEDVASAKPQELVRMLGKDVGRARQPVSLG